MRKITVEMIGLKAMEKKLVRLINKNRGLITETDTIVDDEGAFYNLKFDIPVRRFRKNTKKFIALGDYRVL